MKRTIFTIAIILLLSMTLSVYAQSKNQHNSDNDAETQAFGVHFGNVSGNGYAYRYLGQQLGIQLVGGGFTTGNNNASLPNRVIDNDNYTNPPSLITRTDDGRKYSFNLGGNLIFPLKRTGSALFYLHTGVCWKYSDLKIYKQNYSLDYISNYTSYYEPSGGVYSSHKVKSYVNYGIGPGVELLAGKYFKLSLELPITYTGNDELIMYIPQAGLYYYFK
jgi:hypothetical protein